MPKIKLMLYETIISNKVNKLAKSLPKDYQSEGLKIGVVLMEYSRELAYINSFDVAGRDDKKVFDNKNYRHLFDKYTDQVLEYISFFPDPNQALQALRLLQFRKEVIGTGRFGLDIFTKDFNDFSNLEQKLDEIKKVSFREFEKRSALANIAGELETIGNSETTAKGIGKYISNPNTHNFKSGRW